MIELDRIYNCNCLECLKRIPDGSVDCICTDIPYNETDRRGVGGGLRKIHNGIADDSPFDLGEWLKECWRVCSGSFYIFCGFGQVSKIHEFFLSHKTSTRMIVWEKTNPSPMNGDFTWLFGIEVAMFAKKSGAIFNLHCENTVIRKPIEKCSWHPTAKPVDIMRKFILASTNAGQIVLDPFIGSGTTAIACIKEKRHFIGFELDKQYYEKACERIWNEQRQLKLDFEY